jgi:hypothetical protein
MYIYGVAGCMAFTVWMVEMVAKGKIYVEGMNRVASKFACT